MSQGLTRRLGSGLDFGIDSVKVEDCDEDYIQTELYYKMNWNKAERSMDKFAVD